MRPAKGGKGPLKGAKAGVIAGGIEMEDRISGEAEQTPGADLGRAGTAVKEGMMGSLKGVNEIEAAIVSLVRNTVVDALRLTADVTGMSINLGADVTKGAIKAAEEVGAGLVLSTKGVTKGVIMGVSDVGGDVATVANRAVKGAVKGAAEIGADWPLWRGVLSMAPLRRPKKWGEREEIAKVAVEGAIEAAASVGTAARKR